MAGDIGMSNKFTEEFMLKQKPTLSGDLALKALRAAVVLTKDAVNAVSVTAMDALREALALINIRNESELIDPFMHLDAPIWEHKPPKDIIEKAYDFCEELTVREAGNFYHSFKYLPEDQRRAMCAAYAFCRRADDIADGDWQDRFPGGLGIEDPEAKTYRENVEQLVGKKAVLDDELHKDKMAQLFFFRKKLSTCYNDLWSTDPVFLALKDTIEVYGIQRAYFDDLISGMEDDLYTNRYSNFDDLYLYCYRVASVVGMICIEIYGYDDPKAREYAESWGIFMQLTNVLRDIGEDIERDRVYLPGDELKAMGVDINLLNGEVRRHQDWEGYVFEYAKRARSYLKNAKLLLPLLPKRTRYSPAAMMAFYEAILKEIVRRQGDVFSSRVSLNKMQKLWLAASVYLRHRFMPW